MFYKRIIPLFVVILLAGAPAIGHAQADEQPEGSIDQSDTAEEGGEIVAPGEPREEAVPPAGDQDLLVPEAALQVEEVEDEKLPWSPFVDTRLTFTFADDNLLAGPGETDEPSPGPQFRGSNANNLFFENYNTRDSGFETLTHLVLYREIPTYFDRLTGEAALVLRLDTDPDDRRGATSIGDSSSYVRLMYRPEGWGENEDIAFTGFPVTSDRFRLGYSYRLTWGGNDIFPGAKASVPGARFQITRDDWYFFLGGKSTQLDETVFLRNERATEIVANYGALGGAGIDLTENLRVEVGGGFFTKGTFQRQALAGEKIYAGGGSAQVAWHVGRDVGTSIDLRLYRNDPDAHQVFFRPAKYGPGVSYLLAAEFSYLTQTLEDPDSFGSTVRQPAMAGDVNFAMQFGKNRVFVDAELRDVAFILFNVPSLVPFQAFTDQMDTNPEWFVAGGIDHYIEELRLTPGLRAGIQMPSWVRTDRLPSGVNPPSSLAGFRTLVVRDVGEFDILPQDQDVKPIVAVQATARVDLGDSLAALAEVSYEYDPNRATFTRGETGMTLPTPVAIPSILGFNVVLQARF